MADDVGRMGLDVEDFEVGADKAIAKLSVLDRLFVRAANSLVGLHGIGKLAATALARIGGVRLFGVLAAIGFITKKAYDARVEADKLSNSIETLFNSSSHNAEFSKVEDLKKQLQEIDSLTEKMAKSGDGLPGVGFIRKMLGGSDGGKDLGNYVADIFNSIREVPSILGNMFSGNWNSIDNGKGSQQEKSFTEAAEAKQKLLDDIAKKTRDQTQVDKLKLAGDEEGADLLKEKLDYEEKIGAAKDRGLRDVIKEEHRINEELIKQKYTLREQKKEAEEQKQVNKIHESDLKKRLDYEYKLLTPREKFYKLTAQIVNLNVQISDAEGLKKAKLESQLQTLKEMRLELLTQRNLMSPEERLSADREARKRQSAEKKAQRQIDHEEKEDIRRFNTGAHLDKRQSALKNINNAFQDPNGARLDAIGTKIDRTNSLLLQNLTNE